MRRSLVLVALLLAAPAGAQISEAQAVAAVKALGKVELKNFKTAAKAALAGLDADLDTLEGGLAEDSDPGTVVESVAAIGVLWLDDLDAAFGDSVGDLSVGTAGVLDDLGDGAPLGGLFPAPLDYGTSGALDDALAALVKAGAKAREAGVKRLGKTIAKAEALAGIGLAVTVQWPPALDLQAIDQNDVLGVALGAQLEMLVAGSALDAASDGAVAVIGTSETDADPANLQVIDADGVVDAVEATFVDGPGRFIGLMDDGGNGLPEGNMVVTVDQGGGAFRAVLGIGVR